MMIKYLLLSILLLTYLSNTQVDLQSQYCSLKANTTAQIVYGISPITDGRISTQFLLKTQTYLSNGNLVSLAFFQNQGSLHIEESGSSLTSIIHEDGTVNLLLYIDSLNQYIVAKQITSLQSGQFNYVLFTANLGTAGAMTKFTINSSSDASDNDVSGLNLLKILDIVDGKLIVLLSGDQQTSIYKINTAAQGKLILQGHLSTTQKINVAGGNVQSIFASDSDVVYISSTPSAGDYQSVTYTQLGVQESQSSSSLSIQRLGDLTLAYTSKEGANKFYPVQLSVQNANPTISTVSGTISSFTDNYQNFLAVSTTDLIWYKIIGTTLEVKKLSDSALTQDQRNSLLTILNLANSVSFDGQSALIVTHDVSQTTGSLYSVTFDPTAAKQFLIVNSVVAAINLEADVASNLIEPSVVSGYQTDINCNCISPQIQRFECYSNALKCITVSGSIRQVCLKN